MVRWRRPTPAETAGRLALDERGWTMSDPVTVPFFCPKCGEVVTILLDYVRPPVQSASVGTLCTPSIGNRWAVTIYVDQSISRNQIYPAPVPLEGIY